MQIIDCLLSKNTTKRKPQEVIVLTNWYLPYDDGAGKKKNDMTKKNILQAISLMEMDSNWKRRAENFKVDQNQCSHSNVCSLLIAQKVHQNEAK